MNVSFYDFVSLHHSEFQQKVMESFQKIVSSGQFIEGEYNTAFEKEFASYHQRKHALLVANGTDALELSLRAQGISHGDKVAVPAVTFYATAEAVYSEKAEVVLVDIDETGQMDPFSLERVLKQHPEIKSIMPVHLYGIPAPIEEFEKVIEKSGRNISIVEDGAQAFGGLYSGEKYKGKRLGSSPHLHTFSFYPTKNLGAAGDAGAILVDDEEMMLKLKALRNHGRGVEEKIFGRNSRCDHLQAAFLYHKWQEVEKFQQQRKEVAHQYQELLGGISSIQVVARNFMETSSFHLFPILTKDGKEKIALRDFLQEKKISTSLFYEHSLAHEMPLKGVKGEYAFADKFCQRVLCLPIHPFLTKEQLDYVASSLRSFYGI